MNLAQAFRDRHPGANVVKRARNAIHVETAPGVYVAEIHMGPIHRLDGGEIDTAWVPDSGVYQHQMALADYKAQAKAAFNGAPLVRYEHVASGQWVTLQPRQLDYSNDRNDTQMLSAVQGVTATVDDDTLTWAGAYGAGRDFKWQASTNLLAKELILQTAAAAPTPSAQVLGGANPILRLAYTFAFSAGISPFINGVEWSRNSTEATTGAIEFRLPDGTVAWSFAVPVATGANGEPAPGLVQRLIRSGPNLLCEIRVPYSWLQSAAYPVVIDPTIELQPDETAGLDTYIQEDVPTLNLGTSNLLAIGEWNNGSDKRAHALMKFDLTTVPDTFDNAVLSIFPTSNFASNGGVLRAFRQKRAWVEAQATWNVYATATNWSAAGGFHADDCEQTGIASWTFTAAETLNEFKAITFSVTTKAALDLGNGWLLKTDDELNDLYRHVSSGGTTASQRPKLTITYTEAAAGIFPIFVPDGIHSAIFGGPIVR